MYSAIPADVNFKKGNLSKALLTLCLTLRSGKFRVQESLEMSDLFLMILFNIKY